MWPRLKHHYYSAHYASLCIILGCISHLAIILLFGVLTVKYHEMTKNYIFREFECGLTKKETAELCFKSLRTITDWDNGKEIPKECRRLMKLKSGRVLSNCKSWEGFTMKKNKLELPTGRLISAQELLTAVAILEIDASTDVATKSHLLKYARLISAIKCRK